MIPVTLKLSNFMSYGQTDNSLDFTTFHIACLTGNNGHGKSTLLDAITWSVWGQARGVDGHGGGVDDLVRLGAEQMEVEFTFALENNVYRILRKRDKRRQTSVLEFQVQDGEGFRSLTGDRISETQSKILQVIKMDYDTFVNSAFILQGKADSFTQQKPNERKRILGEILGLAYYDQLESRARELANEQEQQVKLLERELTSLAQDIEQLPDFEVQLQQSKAIVGELEGKVSTGQAELAKVQNEKNRLEGLAAKKAELENSRRAGQQEMLQLQEQLRRLEQQIEAAQKVMLQEAEVTLGYQQFRQVQARLEEMNSLQSQYLKLSQAVAKVKETINLERGKLQVQLSKDEQVLKGLDEAQLQLEALLDKQAKLIEQNGVAKQLEAEIKALEQQMSVYEANINQAKGELSAKQVTLKELRTKYSELQGMDVCPYCTTDLREDSAKQKVLQRVAIDGQQLKQEVESTETQVANSEKELQAEKQRLAKLQEAYKEVLPAGGQLRQLEDQLAQLQLRLQGRVDLVQHVQQLQQQLQAFTEGATPAQRELAQLAGELSRLAYDAAGHQELVETYQKLRAFEEKFHELQKVKQNLSTLEEAKQNLVKLHEAINAKLALNQEMLEQLTEALAGLPKILQQLQALERELGVLLQGLNKASEDLGVWQARVDKARESQAKGQQLEQQLKVAAKEAGYYRELVKAYGKKGIQAIIIENAIPELEQEANKLLTQMTDGRLNLALVTQKGTKSGSIVETLDIQISDELGTRKYELFSGGEAFRVNFALRISLSKMLAHRAGAKLQTLVIDEGFGTQDAQGMERLVEVINVIKDEFEKIIVITHISQLKEAFPTRIEVTKTGSGSHFQVE